MAQPTAYTLSYDFQSWQNANPARPLPAADIEVEFNAISLTTGEIRANLALIQRDDGELANTVVGFDQLKAELRLGIQPPTAWATATSYSADDTVHVTGKLYRAVIAHTSGVFATDLAAGKWEELMDFAAFAGGTPASASASGTAGQVLWDSDYVYVCVATDTWKRAALSTW